MSTKKSLVLAMSSVLYVGASMADTLKFQNTSSLVIGMEVFHYNSKINYRNLIPHLLVTRLILMQNSL